MKYPLIPKATPCSHNKSLMDYLQCYSLEFYKLNRRTASVSELQLAKEQYLTIKDMSKTTNKPEKVEGLGIDWRN